MSSSPSCGSKGEVREGEGRGERVKGFRVKIKEFKGIGVKGYWN
jgi:uncharacterized protein YbbK (DUF523 family)